jgi:hypothetical protein
MPWEASFFKFLNFNFLTMLTGVNRVITGKTHLPAGVPACEGAPDVVVLPVPEPEMVFCKFLSS